MNRKQWLAGSLFLFQFLFPGFSPAPVHGQNIDVNIVSFTDSLIYELGLVKDLERPAAAMKQLLGQNIFRLSKSNNQKLINIFDQSYDSDNLVRIFKDSLQKRLTPLIRTKIQNWLKRSSTQAVLLARRENNTLQGKRKRVIAMYEIDQHPSEAARKHQLAALWQVTEEINQPIETSTIILRSLIKAYGKLSGKHYRDAQVGEIVQNYKKQVLIPSQKAAGKFSSYSMAVKYFEVNTQDLKVYARFIKSAAGQGLMQAISQCMQAAYQAAAKHFLDRIETL